MINPIAAQPDAGVRSAPSGRRVPVGRDSLELPEAMLPREEPTGASELRAAIGEVLGGRSARLVRYERLKPHVHRLEVDLDGACRSLIVKWSRPDAAGRNKLVAWRWLPAVGLEDHGPPLLAVAAERTLERAWHVYDDLPGHPVSARRPVRRHVQAAVEAIARVHIAFAEHTLLPECRLYGGDRGIHFYATNLRDAAVALGSLDGGVRAVALRDALLPRIERLREQEPDRAKALAEGGGPETLLHGDLWPTNAIAVGDGKAVRVRLVDWDEAAVGPAVFDVSTFLLRFHRGNRPWILEAYRRAVHRLAGQALPGEPELVSALETAAYGRLASLLVWSIAAARGEQPPWLLERLAEMIGWLDAVEPVLPTR
jgi:Ser/Thr protein kinase RdoA (MazF antagonist)